MSKDRAVCALCRIHHLYRSPLILRSRWPVLSRWDGRAWPSSSRTFTVSTASPRLIVPAQREIQAQVKAAKRTTKVVSYYISGPRQKADPQSQTDPAQQDAVSDPAAGVGASEKPREVFIADIKNTIARDALISKFWECLGWDAITFKGVRRTHFRKNLHAPDAYGRLQSLIATMNLPVLDPQITAERLLKIYRYTSGSKTCETEPYLTYISKYKIDTSPTLRDVFNARDKLAHSRIPGRLSRGQLEAEAWQYDIRLEYNFDAICYFTTGLKERPVDTDPVMDQKLDEVVANWYRDTVQPHPFTAQIALMMAQFSNTRLNKLARAQEKQMKIKEKFERMRLNAQLKKKPNYYDKIPRRT